MRNRVAITGIGVVSPNGVGVNQFLKSLKTGQSGISFLPELKELNFSCQIGGIPTITNTDKHRYFSDLELRNFNSSGILYGVIAGMDAVLDAGIEVAKEEPLWDLGIIFGAGISGVDKFREAIYRIDNKNVRRLGSTTVIQTMTSGVSAYLSRLLGAGNRVTANSSACATGTESLLMGYEHIASGKATTMLCGSTSDHGPYIWGGFDALRIMNYKSNENPKRVPGPMSTEASGFVPGSGAGAYVLENLEHARKRGVKIYAEIVGGNINNGGQRGGGSMTAPNNEAVQRCIQSALKNGNIHASEVDYINGHLTGTIKDSDEINNWSVALNLKGKDFPFINSLKGMTGHCLAACGSIEIVATILQMNHNFIFPNVNLSAIHGNILSKIDSSKIPKKAIETELDTVLKANFGFGDVNACVIFQKFKSE